ncbi:hypothetical protein BDV96DRAFT_629545 [Lophiotrema nucula]|uniref:RING-type domain-containing protein n=1 Tax=Lophiotrema nucula TaxID=690887 RepID=A0A6A5ZIA6_9PLEO|nr:hypothetical protein BDV96DRAFT_629545 [Lophiotrema nucula]
MSSLVDRATFLAQYITVCDWPDHECLLCQESFSPDHTSVTFTHSTSCKGHTFCRDAITAWLNVDGVNTCPTCRHTLFELPLEEQWQEYHAVDYEDEVDEEPTYHILSAPDLRPQQPTWPVTRAGIEVVVQALWEEYWGLTAEYRSEYAFWYGDYSEDEAWANFGPSYGPRDVFISTAEERLRIDWSLLNGRHWRTIDQLTRKMTTVIRDICQVHISHKEGGDISPEEEFDIDPFKERADVTSWSVDRLAKMFARLADHTVEVSQDTQSNDDVMMEEAPEPEPSAIDEDESAPTATWEIERSANNNREVIDLTSESDEGAPELGAVNEDEAAPAPYEIEHSANNRGVIDLTGSDSDSDSDDDPDDLMPTRKTVTPTTTNLLIATLWSKYWATTSAYPNSLPSSKKPHGAHTSLLNRT